jgi:6-phosphogluconate dehydrogenase
MENTDKNKQCQIGMVGLGIMGRNLLLNMADHGFVVAGYDKDKEKVDSLHKEAKQQQVYGAAGVEKFLQLLQTPRAIMLLVPAGRAVDSVISDLLPHLQAGDLIIDAGNSHFTDSDRRMQKLQALGLQFLAVGVSGGEKGARKGPSIMPGGTKSAYERVRPIFEAVAAKVNGEPCVTYLGAGSVGHYVKMVHNGIEYGIMQLIAESYDIMKRGLGCSNAQLSEVYANWNKNKLASYLIEITAEIFAQKDDKTAGYLIDEIWDVAKQNGTGMWTSESAMELQIPVPTIDLAVAMRDLSVLVKEHQQMQNLYERPMALLNVDQGEFLQQLESALFTAMTIAYAQGMALLKVASEKYAYGLDLEAVAKIWRAGCIIRAALLEDISAAFRLNKQLPNLLLDQKLSYRVMDNQEGLRKVISLACGLGVPMPTLMMSLAYLDTYRSVSAGANLIQAQRDYFGSHTYERRDVKGTFHTEWKEENPE